MATAYLKDNLTSIANNPTKYPGVTLEYKGGFLIITAVTQKSLGKAFGAKPETARSRLKNCRFHAVRGRPRSEGYAYQVKVDGKDIPDAISNLRHKNKRDDAVLTIKLKVALNDLANCKDRTRHGVTIAYDKVSSTLTVTGNNDGMKKLLGMSEWRSTYVHFQNYGFTTKLNGRRRIMSVKVAASDMADAIKNLKHKQYKRKKEPDDVASASNYTPKRERKRRTVEPAPAPASAPTAAPAVAPQVLGDGEAGKVAAAARVRAREVEARTAATLGFGLFCTDSKASPIGASVKGDEGAFDFDDDEFNALGPLFPPGF